MQRKQTAGPSTSPSTSSGSAQDDRCMQRILDSPPLARNKPHRQHRTNDSQQILRDRNSPVPPPRLFHQSAPDVIPRTGPKNRSQPTQDDPFDRRSLQPRRGNRANQAAKDNPHQQR